MYNMHVIVKRFKYAVNFTLRETNGGKSITMVWILETPKSCIILVDEMPGIGTSLFLGEAQSSVLISKHTCEHSLQSKSQNV